MSDDDVSCLVRDKHYVDGVCMPETTSVEHLKDVKELNLNPSDVMVTGYPKSGNVWVTTTVNAILNAENLDEFEQKQQTTTLVDIPAFYNEVKKKHSPKVLMSHLRYHMLPEDINKKGIKVINISRDPRDVAVSYYHFCQINKFYNYQGTWDAFFGAFMKGQVYGGSWFDYQKDWMSYHNKPNILFIEYEKYLANSTETINQIATFLGISLNKVVLDRIESLLSFKSMQSNPMFNRMNRPYIDKSKGQFMRSGKSGDWKNYFTPEQEEKFDSVYQTFASENSMK